MFWALEARISLFYYTELLELNQEKIREHPWRNWENIFRRILKLKQHPWKNWENNFRRILKLKHFEILETLGVHFLKF